MTPTQMPAGAGPATPESDEALNRANGQGPGEQDRTDSQHSADAADCAQRCGKDFERLRAQLALAGGFELYALADGTFLVTRWDRSRPLHDLQAVEAFARQVGAPL